MAGVGSLMLLDTASLYFRAFFGVPETVRAPDGTPVNAVRGLLDMIGRLVRARQPSRLVACLDADWRPAFRVAAIPSYKAHRLARDGTEETPPALAAQIPEQRQIISFRNILIHGYDMIDEEVVWKIVQIDLPILKRRVEALLAALTSSERPVP